MESSKDLLAELDLNDLFQKREEAILKQKATAEQVQTAMLLHVSGFWLGGCTMLLAAVVVVQTYPGGDPVGMFLFSASVVLCIGMWTAILFPATTVQKRKGEAAAARRKVKDIEERIAFCHRVLEEARQVKVRKYAEAWVEKELS